MKKHMKSGYILILTLMIISVSIIIVTYLTTKGMVYSGLVRTLSERERARQLARSGIQLAISQLSTTADDEEKKEEKKPEKTETVVAPGVEKVAPAGPVDDAKKLLTAVLPQLNKMQTFALKEKIDGVDGTIGFAISSEEGKININALYDFEKQKFIGEGAPEGDGKKLLQEIFGRIKEKLGGDNLFDPFEKFLKQRQYKLNEVTELLTIDGFKIFKDALWRVPKGKEKDQDMIALTDIFTVGSSGQSIEPWLLSASARQILGIKTQDAGSKEKEMGELLKKFKINSAWKTDWDSSLGELYGVNFANLGKHLPVYLNTKFEPKMFSVVSYGTVGAATYTMSALLERTKEVRDKKNIVTVRIKKIYVV